jgi:hypothetical protein
MVVMVNCVAQEVTFPITAHNRRAIILRDMELDCDEGKTQPADEIHPVETCTAHPPHAFDEPGVCLRFVTNGTEVADGGVIRYVQRGWLTGGSSTI